MVEVRSKQGQHTVDAAQGQNEKSTASIQGCVLYLNMNLSGWLCSKPREEIAPFIVDWCWREGITEPSLIASAGKGFYIKWLFVAPITPLQLGCWHAVQKYLHGKFECLGSDPDFMDAGRQPEVCVLHQADAELTFDKFARRLPLTKDAGQAYQAARMKERKAEQRHLSKQKPTEDKQGILSNQEAGIGLSSILSFFHQADNSEGWLCIRRKQPGSGRKALYDWLFSSDGIGLKTGDVEHDCYFSAGDFAIKKRSEKWVSSIRCNFLSLVWERSELNYVPVPEDAISLIYTRCNERGIPRPTFIMHTGDGLFLAWAYDDAITKLEPPNSFHFNHEWSDVERFLFSQFWDLGADPRQLHAAAMVRMPGSLNTTAKTEDRMVRVLDASGPTYSFREILDRARGVTRQTVPEIPCGWEHDLLAFHEGGRNLVCLGYFKSSVGEGAERKWMQKWVPARCLLDELLRFDLDQDLYVTQLEFSARKRDVNHVTSIRVNFLDIDWKLQEGHDLTPETWKDRILEHCREHHIPEPNAVVFSGNGLHVKWIYTAPIAKEELERWNLAQRLLLSQFEELGADAASIDAARVLRVPGSRNGKTGTVDRRVRLLHHSSPKYTFDEFLDEVKTSIPANPEAFNACLVELEEMTSEASLQHTIPDDVCFVMNSEEELKRAEENWLLHELNFHHPKDAWMFLENAAEGQQLWVPVRELHHYLKHLDLSKGWRMSSAEFRRTVRAEDEGHIAALPFNFVNITQCPEGYALNSQECIDMFNEKCRQVCGVGILKPNQFIYTGQSLLAVWGYNHPLPGIALSRWKAVQEFITHHFNDWGTESDMTYLSADAMLPVTSFLNSASGSPAQIIYHHPAAYSFDDLATNILPWSQAEVRKYENEKETKEGAEDQKANSKKSQGFAHRALARYKDIAHLLRMRRRASGSVSEGYRELCVFWAVNCGIQAGLITLDNFDAYAQKLIALCGADFDDCGPRTLASLKSRLAGGRDVYSVKTKNLIKELGITPEEQKQMKVINTLRRSRRYRTPRGQWLARHHQEINKPWERLHISRSTYFARRKRQREAIAVRRDRHSLAQTQMRAFLIQEGTGLESPFQLPRTGMPLYYERDVEKGENGVIELQE